MHNVVVSKKSHRLAVVTCNCGLNKSFDRGKDATNHGERHARNNHGSLIVMTNNVEERTDIKRAHPGRAAGGVNYSPAVNEGAVT